MNWKHSATTCILALAIAGCGNGSNPPPATSTAPAPAASTQVDYNAIATKLLADGEQYVKDHKWDLADKTVNQLVEMKPKLSPDNAKHVDDLKRAFDMAKAATQMAPKLP